MIKRFTKTLIAVGLFQAAVFAQVPVPAPPQSKGIALVGGTAHIGNGQVIENAVVTFENGKLVAVADQTSIRINRGQFDIIDTTGKHIYPGLILPANNIGLNEVNSVRAMRDHNETGDYNPNVRALVAYNTDSEFIPTMRFNGILMAQSMPSGGSIRGTSSIVQLDAWNWEDAAYVVDDGIHMEWPGRSRTRFNRASFTVETVDNENYKPEVEAMDKMFSDSTAYAKAESHHKRNLKLEAMRGLFDGSKTLYIHTNAGTAMVESVNFAKRHGVQKMVIVGARSSLDVAEFLKKHDVPVILGALDRLPDHAHSNVDHQWRLPAMLHEAGVRFSFGQGGIMGARNMAFLAGMAVSHGLDYEQAVAAMTGNTAEILGIGDRVGTLEVGKDATLFVSEGDALDIRTNILTHAYIQGRHIQLDGRQQDLWRRYKDKYGH